MSITRSDAIFSLVGGGLSGLEDGSVTNYHDGQTPPSEAAIDAEVARLEKEYDALSWKRARETEYPSIQECIHAILDDQLTPLQEKRQAVKLKYPKSA